VRHDCYQTQETTRLHGDYTIDSFTIASEKGPQVGSEDCYEKAPYLR
jgi:hypothetical protein